MRRNFDIMAKRILALLLCAVMLTSCFVGCSSADDEDKGQYITAYLSNDIYDLDPANAYTNESLSNVVGLLFDTLFKLDSNKKVKKSLVTKYWTTEDDNSQEYIMYLRLKSDAYWSDGTALSANDVVYAWKRLLEVDASYSAAALLFDIKNARAAKEGDCSIDDVGVTAPETTLVEIRFEQSIDYDQFLLNLTSVALAPLRSDITAKSTDWAKKPGTMVCSGPFRLARINLSTSDTDTYEDVNWSELDPNETGKVIDGSAEGSKSFAAARIVDFMLERNTYYYRDAEEDAIDKSVTPYRISVDCSLTAEQLVAQYEAGMMMYIGDIPLSVRTNETIQKNVDVSSYSMSTSSVYLNENAMIADGTETGSALFANEKVRQALSLAVDRAALAEMVVYADAATGLVPTGVWETGANRKKSFRSACDADYEYLKYDLTQAKSLLSEAGINPDKYSFSLTISSYDDVQTALAEKIVEAWNALGFHVTIRVRGTILNNDYYKYTDSVPTDMCDDLYAEALRSTDYEAILFDYVAYSVDPYGVLAPFAKKFSGMAMDMSDPSHYELPGHATGYNNETYNELMEKIYAEKTISARADDLREAEGILMNDLPIIPLIFNKTASITSSKLKKLDSTYYMDAVFTKAKIRSYDSYLAAGKAYVNEHFSELAFKDYKDCTYADFESFKSANTVYAQYYLDEVE
jgi:oligopeptide transport system substrate-binding protein